MKKIQLTRGQFAKVDDEDYEELAQHKWIAQWINGTRSFYAQRTLCFPGGGRRVRQMHRAVLGLPQGLRPEVDHINHDTLDNRKANLRAVTRRQNMENSRNQSRYGVGVYRRKEALAKPFKVQARLDGRQVHLGYFATAKEGQRARSLFLKKQTIKGGKRK